MKQKKKKRKNNAQRGVEKKTRTYAGIDMCARKKRLGK